MVVTYPSVSPGLFCIRNQDLYTVCNRNVSVSACIKRRNHVSVLFCYKTISTRIEIVSGLFMDTYLMNMK